MGFAGTQAHENFEAAILKIAFERDQSAGATFFNLPKKAVDLGLVEKKFAGAVGFRVGPIAVAVGGDVERVKPSLAVFNPAERVGEVAVTGADGFDFGAGQDDAGFN